MTKKELSQLSSLKREILQYKDRLSRLKELAVSTSSGVTGMPIGKAVSDRVGKYAAEIADLEAALDRHVFYCFKELNRLSCYISGIDNSNIREILTLRYVEDLTWQQVAQRIGGGNSESGVQMQVNRFLKRDG